MSEQRFTYKAMVIIDTFENKAYDLSDNENLSSLVMYMNIEDDYITRLEHHLQRFKGMIGEQQATIRRLQDLCGESDSENAKLRIENKMLEKEVNLLRPTNLEQYEQIQKLQEENEQLKNKLNSDL